jgi:hypothetical protein
MLLRWVCRSKQRQQCREHRGWCQAGGGHMSSRRAGVVCVLSASSAHGKTQDPPCRLHAYTKCSSSCGCPASASRAVGGLAGHAVLGTLFRRTKAHFA